MGGLVHSLLSIRLHGYMLSDPHQMQKSFASVSIKLGKTVVIIIFFSSKSRDHQTKVNSVQKMSKINSIGIEKGDK